MKTKACPFCGGEGHLLCGPRYSIGLGDPANGYEVEGYCVECEDCSCEGEWDQDETIAIEKWNRRVEDKG